MSRRPSRSTSRGPVAIPDDLHADAPIDALCRVARSGAKVTLSRSAIAEVTRSRRVVERALRSGQAHYGINTGFGSLAKQRIGPEDLRTLQRNLVRSHSAGAGEPLRPELVRGTMALLAASLARGKSGVRPIVIDTLLAMLNRGVVPVVPSVGSVGASGDLAPLAAIALVVIGEGRATCEGREMSGAAAMKLARIRPVELDAKEGLALINGTHLMAAEGAMLAHDARIILGAARVALAMSIDACRASHGFLDLRLYEARPHPTVYMEVQALRDLLEDSRIRESHVENDPRVQDPYSLRAAPTVHGAAAEVIVNVMGTITAELASVTDNPLVFSRGEGEPIVSGANFHGMPLAIALDTLAIALSHLAGISERRTFLLTSAAEPEMRQKPYLIPATRRAGLQSGLMIAQYTAAACVNELIGLAAPASVANLSTCAGMEDYNSFGPRSAAKARRGVELCARVIAIELLCAAQGLESHRPLTSGRGVEQAFKLIRRLVPPLADDRPLTDDIERLACAVLDGAFGADDRPV